MIRISALLTFFFLVSGVAHAQFSPGDILSISINPTYPRPYETIQVTVSSTQIDLSGAKTSLYVNGKLINSYTGTETTPVTLGAPGTQTVISATTVINGKTYTKKISVGTGDVSLVLEADSTAHPFYQGGLLVAAQGKVRLVAIPDLRKNTGTRIDPSLLVYTWKFGGQVLQSQSGIGKNVLVATAPVRFRDAAVTVTVTSQDGAQVAEARILVTPVDPFIRMYVADPLTGVDFTNSLSSPYQLSGTEESLRGVAYFFSSRPDLLWSVNGQGNTTDDTITIRRSGSAGGRAVLALSARLGAANQSVNKTISVLFGSQQSTNIFGF